MKIVFLGTPQFAEIVLKKLIDNKQTICAVVCQPDAVNARNNTKIESPVKQFALKNNLTVFQFENIDKEGAEVLKKLDADIFITVAYGQILSQEILNIPKLGTVNVHGSLLPELRGATPIQTAIANGQTKTGVSIVCSNAGIDSGDIMAKAEIVIEKEDTTLTLSQKLANEGASLLLQTLPHIQDGTAVKQVQDESFATHTFQINKEESILNFSLPATKLVNIIRALNPNPVAKIKLGEDSVKIYEAKAESTSQTGVVGKILTADQKSGLKIQCKFGVLSIKSLQISGGKQLDVKNFLCGNKLFHAGDVLPSQKSEGLVVSASKNNYEAKMQFYNLTCTAKQQLTDSGIVVGDYVSCENDVITKILPRKTKLIRPNIANLDQIFIVLAPIPEPDFLLVDKLLLFCFENGVTPILVINKYDMNGENLFLKTQKTYSNVAKVIKSSAKTGDVTEIRNSIGKKMCGFAGQSAVGKSSIINALLPLSNQLVADVSEKILRGKNTTSGTTLFQVNRGWLADTAGFSALDEKLLESPFFEIASYYPDFVAVAKDCKFKPCNHINEPDCAVKKAIKDGAISQERYQRYTQIFLSLKNMWEKNHG
ncbi:MAG: methionyl-tRNA formyltransferase [Clostridia bacterium]